MGVDLRLRSAGFPYGPPVPPYNVVFGLSVPIDLDAVVPGLVSEVDGSVTYAASDDAEVYSVVDEIARRALNTDARVLGARRDELPGRAPLLAILRYQFA